MIEISALDLHYLIKEMQFLSGARVDKISQPEKETVVFQFYAKGKEKQILKIALPNLFYLAEKKPEAAEKLFGFCSALRKYLSNAKLAKIEQLNSERIAKLLFIAKEAEYILFVELFAKGNIILCKKDFSIIVPLRTSKFKDREIKAGVKYTFPEKEINFFDISAKNLNKYKKQQKQTISKLIAVELGFGGQYSKEICKLSNIGLSEKSLNDGQVNTLIKSIKSITSKKVNPFAVYSDSRINAVPFELEIYKDMKKEKKKSFNSAVEFAAKAGKAKKITKSQKELERLKKIIKLQEEQINEMEKTATESQKKGELIYEKYQLLNEILEEIRKARKKYSWKEIKSKLKGHKLIKEINEKNGEIVLEV